LEATAQDVRAYLVAELRGYADVPVVAAMRHALAAGGKGLRGFLVLEGAALHGVGRATALPAAAAIEAVHTYSLVHDDLPSMDDDATRRGAPTVHVKWDEATAILAGDALQAMAFELLGRVDVPMDRRVDLTVSLAQAAGARGMVLGQALDIAAEHAPQPLGLEAITMLQAAKTGALIRWSGEAGARLAGADTAALRTYAEALGLAFQIADDILDVAGDAKAAGKALGKDAAAGKATFVSLLGREAAQARAASLVAEAEAALASYGPSAGLLRAAARFVIERDR